MENRFYVYGHYVSGSNEPFYIGKGHKNRAYETHNRSKEWNPVYNNSQIIIKILETDLMESVAFEKEKLLIRMYGRLDDGTGILVNKTDGGDGIAGQIYTDERREKVRQSAKRTVVERLGEQKAKEWLENQSRVRKEMYKTGKIVPYWKGKSRDKSTIEKIRNKKLGIPSSKRGKGKSVIQLDKYGNVVKTHACVSALSEYIKIPIQTVYTAIKRKSCLHGYYFKYY